MIGVEGFDPQKTSFDPFFISCKPRELQLNLGWDELYFELQRACNYLPDFQSILVKGIKVHSVQIHGILLLESSTDFQRFLECLSWI